MLPENFRSLDSAEWLALLKRSISEPIIDGIEFPRFPPADIQERFVGSAYEHALDEGSNFYRFVRESAGRLRNPIGSDTRALDFGTGWGRYLRLMHHDIPSYNLYGVDVHADMVNLCSSLKVPGSVSLIDPIGKLPFPDNHFDLITAYSVFTHLPEHVHRHWLAELARVAAHEATIVLTVEPPRFIEFCSNVDSGSQSAWHRTLKEHIGDGKEMKAAVARGEYVYIPTGGGDGLPAATYGDAVIPEEYVRSNWGKLFKVVQYLDDPNSFWQAVVVLQKSSDE